MKIRGEGIRFSGGLFYAPKKFRAIKPVDNNIKKI